MTLDSLLSEQMFSPMPLPERPWLELQIVLEPNGRFQFQLSKALVPHGALTIVKAGSRPVRRRLLAVIKELASNL